MKSSRRFPGEIEFALCRSADLFERGLSGRTLDLKLLSRAWGTVASLRPEPGELEMSTEFSRWARVERLAIAHVLAHCRRMDAERCAVRGSP